MDSDVIFGKMDPRRLGFNLREVFAEANSYSFGWKKQKKYDYRGSSAIWNDDQEFATPKPLGKVHDTSNTMIGSNVENLAITKFSPFQTSKLNRN